MKACAGCGRLYPDDAGFCPVDGTALTSATQVPVQGDASDPRVGQLFCDRYQIRRVVADGGMGRVYEALDMHERRNVALKILHADVARDEVAVERFKREFEVSRTLPHQHIVEVLGFQPTHDGTFALIMEFLYGEELRATLKREAVIAPARLVRMLAQAALALDAAHATKLVHRDLKPDNLFLCQTREGDITKVLDFGSVKDKGESAKKLTVLGTTIGSPFYMAPEQAQGLDTLDHRADVWALAAIAYECMTAHVPFAGNNGPSILLEILTKDPKPPSEAGKGQKYPVPPTLDPVMTQAFKKMQALRTPSVGALADAVAAAYGLEGSHQKWATVPEGEIAALIEQKMPTLMQAKPAAPTGPADASDSFFGEMGSLGDVPSGPGAAAMGAPSSALPDLAAAGIPKAAPSWLMLALVGGGALLLGVIIVLILVLR
jgi:serine/threonine protein kinase